MRLFVTAFLAIASFHAQASMLPDTVGLHVASLHSNKQYTNSNLGINASWGPWTAGAFRNSERRHSVYAGYLVETEGYTSYDVKAGLMAGAVTGYAARKVTPILVPSLSFRISEGKAGDQFKQTRAELTYIPKIEKQGAHALHLSFRFFF